jgi:hypothetical protein
MSPVLRDRRESPRARDPKVVAQFKKDRAAAGDDCCEVCRWRPPRALRDVAGGRIDRLLHAHHIVPVACGGAGGAGGAENLILLCPNHHAIAHHIGTIGRLEEGAAWRPWAGPRTREDLIFAVNLMAKRDEYVRFVALDSDSGRYLARLHGEAIAQDAIEEIRIHRAFTVVRGGQPLRSAR